MPLLVTDEEGSFVAAIHAGWRGLASGIIENTLKKINAKRQIYSLDWPAYQPRIF